MPSFELEQALLESGHSIICGVDEVGRGPLAGPVTAAAVILDPSNYPAGLDDSKKLSEAKRIDLYSKLIADAWVSVVSLNAQIIDQLNIRSASLTAMQLAVLGLERPPSHALIDGNAKPDNLPCSATTVVKGDSHSISIAAASIIAKVVRDHMMLRCTHCYPEYQFTRHKGYPTALHKAELVSHGITKLHRRSFKPIRETID